MILKVRSEKEKLITVIKIAMFEHNYEQNALTIWDVADNSAIITPKYTHDLNRVVRELYAGNRAEIDAEIEWE